MYRLSELSLAIEKGFQEKTGYVPTASQNEVETRDVARPIFGGL
jgi:hypothetical protein